MCRTHRCPCPSPEKTTNSFSRGAMTTACSGFSPGRGMYVSRPLGRSRYHSPGRLSDSRTLITRHRCPLGNEPHQPLVRVCPVTVTTRSWASIEEILNREAAHCWKTITSTSSGLAQPVLNSSPEKPIRSCPLPPVFGEGETCLATW